MAERDQQVQGVVVRIFGEEYRIGGDPAQVQQVADFVDRKMQEISDEHGGRLPKAQVAMLAAMEITADYFRVMQERKAFTAKAHESIDRLTRLVEERASLPEESEESRVKIPRVEQRLQGQPDRLRDPTSVP